MESKIMLDGRIEVFPDGTIYRIKDGNREMAKVFRTSREGRYNCIMLQIDGKQKTFYVHRLVAEAFVPNPEGKPNVNHIDGNPSNNNADNLRWVTPSESTIHAYKLGLVKFGKGTVPCELCGEPTYSTDNICNVCKNNLEKEIRKDEKKALIRDTLGNIDFSRLTDLEKRAVTLRLEYLSYEEIGSIMGCSKQCVEQRLHNALKKCCGVRKPRKRDREELAKIKNRIEKKKLKIKSLNDEAKLIFEEIDVLNNKLELLEREIQIGGQ